MSWIARVGRIEGLRISLGVVRIHRAQLYVDYYLLVFWLTCHQQPTINQRGVVGSVTNRGCRISPINRIREINAHRYEFMKRNTSKRFLVNHEKNISRFWRGLDRQLNVNLVIIMRELRSRPRAVCIIPFLHRIFGFKKKKSRATSWTHRKI